MQQLVLTLTIDVDGDDAFVAANILRNMAWKGRLDLPIVQVIRSELASMTTLDFRVVRAAAQWESLTKMEGGA